MCHVTCFLSGLLFSLSFLLLFCSSAPVSCFPHYSLIICTCVYYPLCIEALVFPVFIVRFCSSMVACHSVTFLVFGCFLVTLSLKTLISIQILISFILRYTMERKKRNLEIFSMQLQLMRIVAFQPYKHNIKAVQINSLFVLHGRKNVSQGLNGMRESELILKIFINVWGSVSSNGRTLNQPCTIPCMVCYIQK